MKEYFRYALVPHLWDGLKNTYSKPSAWAWLAAGGGLTVIAHQYQWDVNEYFEDHRLPYQLDRFGNDVFGVGEFQAGTALAMMFAGWCMDSDEVADTGEVLLEAQAIQGAIVNIIKPIAGKERPDGSDNLSFPSGHTSTAFCAAAVLHDRAGWELGVPMYAFAVITAMARMDVQAHWLPDTVMGATIAMVTGYGVSKTHDDHPYDVRWGRKKPGLVVIPSIGPGTYGLTVTAGW